MGKQGKAMRSSVKALHEALASFRPAVGSPLCIQPSKTLSFRDVFASFDSIDYVLPVADASPTFYSSDLLSGRPGRVLGRVGEALPSSELGLLYKAEEGEDEEAVSVSAATTVGSSSISWSSRLSSSSGISLAVAASATPDDAKGNGAEANDPHYTFPNDIACSERFFFSPCSSKSIAAESSPEAALEKAPLLPPEPTGPERGVYDEDDVFDVLLERKIDDILMDTAAAAAAAAAGTSTLTRESVPVAMASRDLYGDFRNSMEEMVAAHSLRDWPDLLELLHCYLRLNDKETHKFIALAFMDLLLHLSPRDKAHRSSPSVHGDTSKPPSLRSPPLPSPRPPAPSPFSLPLLTVNCVRIMKSSPQNGNITAEMTRCVCILCMIQQT